MPLALHTIFRPTTKEEPVDRADIISFRKLIGEGALSETKIVLGWLLDDPKFVIKLPSDKERAWLLDVDDEKELESLIGKLNHKSHIIWEKRYFLSRLRYRLK